MYELEGKPDYRGSRDEIVRADIENKFTRSITLLSCCGNAPKEYFVSCTDYYVRCPKCKKRTRTYRHLYEAKQAWNRKEFEKEGN